MVEKQVFPFLGTSVFYVCKKRGYFLKFFLNLLKVFVALVKRGIEFLKDFVERAFCRIL